MAEHIDKASVALQLGLYGPRYCAKCDAVQPVKTYKLQGSDWTSSEGTKMAAGFIGAHVCTVCMSQIAGKEPARGE